MYNKVVINESPSEKALLNECLDECLGYNAEITRLLEAKRNYIDAIVKELTPSWFKRPCFVKVHYKELDYPYYEDIGARGSEREWIDKVSGEMYLLGFTISEIATTYLKSFPIKSVLSFDDRPTPDVSEIAFVPILYRSKPLCNDGGDIIEHSGTRVTMFDGTKSDTVKITGFEIIDGNIE